jgi:cytochrome c-type biogenesis protein CcmH
MTIAFWASVALLLGGALLFVLPPLLRPATTRAGMSPMAAYRDQRAQIDAEFAQGTITKEQHAQALEELQTRVIEEVGEVGGDKPVAQQPQSKAFVGTIAALIPIGALALYFVLGSPDALRSPAEQQAASDKDAPHAMSQEQMETMVQALADKLKQNPNDANGWHMLARSYVVFQRLPEAAQAYDKAYQLNRTDPGLIADYADVLAMVNGRSLDGRPEQLVKEALKLDPQHQKSLSLAGTAAFNRGDFNGAAEYWKKLLATVPPGSQPAASVQANIDQALAEAAKAGHKPATSPTDVAAAPAAAAPKSTAAASGGAVEGSVTLADAVKGSLPPGATLFVYARPADGSRMPLAILRASADKFPFQFKLDDSMAMSPEARLSLREQVQLVARVSKTGNAMPQPGDLTGSSGPVKVGARDVKLVITEVVK